MKSLTIEPKAGAKGRSFHALMVASIEADLLWPNGSTVVDTHRPVWAMFGGSDNELRAFMANLVAGRKANYSKNGGYSKKQDCVEFLRSVGYQTIWQREEEGSLATVYIPGLFQMDPGMVDPSGIRFILLPTKAWHKAQNIPTAPIVQHVQRCGYELPVEQLEELAPIAYLFASYLDRRTRCPLVADGRFFLQLMLACLKHKGAHAYLASFSTKEDFYYRHREGDAFGAHPINQYHEWGVEQVGLMPGLAFQSTHEVFEKLLADEVATFFRLTQSKR